MYNFSRQKTSARIDFLQVTQVARSEPFFDARTNEFRVVTPARFQNELMQVTLSTRNERLGEV